MRMRGFTLIEVLVALAVASLTLLAIGGTAALSSGAAATLQERTLATWVADNELTRLRLLRSFPDTGSREGTAELAGRDWRWRMRVVDTADADLRRIEVSVSPAGRDEVAALLVGFASRSASRTGSP